MIQGYIEIGVHGGIHSEGYIEGYIEREGTRALILLRQESPLTRRERTCVPPARARERGFMIRREGEELYFQLMHYSDTGVFWLLEYKF